MRWRMIAGLMLICIVLILPGAVNGAAPDKNSSVTLMRGMCYGTCPVYSVTLSENGTVIYDGEMYVKETGVRNGTINASVFTRLMDQVDMVGVFKMKDTYTGYDITDMPSATLTIQEGNITKRVEHYYGDLNAPITLTELEDLVDQSVNITQWTTPYQMENIGSEEI
ncbi:MAG: DUF6438 domain-containing protein [Methanobacteriota archaeon]